MFSRGRILITLVLGVFVWGMLALFEARFESGDLYPKGSSLRSDALGTRAIADAIAEALPTKVSRHRGRVGRLRTASDATIIVAQLPLVRLVVKRDPLVSELTDAARSGARVVVALDDFESQSCKMSYCNEDKKSRCVDPAARVPVRAGESKASDVSCSDAALGLWGFEVGGTPSVKSGLVERASTAENWLPARLPWYSPAKFIDLDPEYRTLYARGNDAVLVERRLGKGSLVLMSAGYLLSNEAQREDRHAELLTWLIGDKSRVIFEESHLGVKEPRGIMTLIRELGLEGIVIGGILLFGLFAWQRLRPLSRRVVPNSNHIKFANATNSTMHSLLHLRMTKAQAMNACLEEAKHMKLARIVERSNEAPLKPTVDRFNRVFVSEQERPKV